MAFDASMFDERAVLDYLGVDEPDRMASANVRASMAAAAAWLNGALGPSLAPAEGEEPDPRAAHVFLAVCADLYDNRSFLSDGGLSGKVGAATRALVSDFCAQMRLEALP